MQILSILTSPEVLAILGPIVLGAIGWVLRTVFKEQAAAKEQLFSVGVEIAYSIVTEIAKRTENTIDDKAATAIGILREWMHANDQKLSPVDEVKAKLLFQAMHGKELVQLGR